MTHEFYTRSNRPRYSSEELREQLDRLIERVRPTQTAQSTSSHGYNRGGSLWDDVTLTDYSDDSQRSYSRILRDSPANWKVEYFYPTPIYGESIYGESEPVMFEFKNDSFISPKSETEDVVVDNASVRSFLDSFQ